MNLLLWSGELHDDLLPTMQELKKMGFDGVEIPMFNLELDYRSWGKKLDDLGLARTAVTVRNVEDNPISPDAAVRARGVELNKRTLDQCAACGVESLIGPIHSALGHFTGKGPTSDEWKWGIESMRATAEHAHSVGIQLGVEPLNRFECYFLNGQEDAARFVREVNHPACGMMYDTFHANIEEKCSATAIRNVRDVLYHVHLSENDRSTPGMGDVRWDVVFSALKEIQYDGWCVIEAFGLALPELAAATKIWRRMFVDELQLARDGLAFIKKNLAS